MGKYKLLAFDWDGTLMDSIDVIVNSIHLTAKAMDLPICTDQQAKDVIGLKLDKAVYTIYPDLSDEQIKHFLKHYATVFVELEKTSSKLFPNVIETLEKLRADGFLLAVATGKSRKGLDRILNQLQLTHFFDATRCADETAGKPDPMMLNDLLQHFSLNPMDALMVGDASFDLQMANNAHIDALAVSYGAQSMSVLDQYNPVGVIHSFEALYPWLIKSHSLHR